MAVIPTQSVNITIQQGQNFSQAFTVQDATPADFDMTAYDVEARIAFLSQQGPGVDSTHVIPEGTGVTVATAIATLALTPVQTAKLPSGSFQWALVVKDADELYYAVKGQCTVLAGF